MPHKSKSKATKTKRKANPKTKDNPAVKPKKKVAAAGFDTKSPRKPKRKTAKV